MNTKRKYLKKLRIIKYIYSIMYFSLLTKYYIGSLVVLLKYINT